MVVGIERLGATGGASSSPTKRERDSADVIAYQCIQMLVLRKARDSAVLEGLVWGEGRQGL